MGKAWAKFKTYVEWAPGWTFTEKGKTARGKEEGFWENLAEGFGWRWDPCQVFIAARLARILGHREMWWSPSLRRAASVTALWRVVPCVQPTRSLGEMAIAPLQKDERKVWVWGVVPYGKVDTAQVGLQCHLMWDVKRVWGHTKLRA